MIQLYLHDIVETKKVHPCGCKEWEILRVGMDIKFRCLGCNHEIMVPRRKAETMIKKFVVRGEEFNET